MTITIDPHITPVFIPLSVTIVSVLVVLWIAWCERESSGWFSDLFTAIAILGAAIANIAAWGSYLLYKIFS